MSPTYTISGGRWAAGPSLVLGGLGSPAQGKQGSDTFPQAEHHKQNTILAKESSPHYRVRSFLYTVVLPPGAYKLISQFLLDCPGGYSTAAVPIGHASVAPAVAHTLCGTSGSAPGRALVALCTLWLRLVIPSGSAGLWVGPWVGRSSSGSSFYLSSHVWFFLVVLVRSSYC